ncbi:hypothetical protein Tco_1576547 [Tanacetum coccineum]
MEVFISGLPRSIEGNVTALKPQTLEEATNIAQRLMDQIIRHNFVQETNNHKSKLDDKGHIINNNNYQNNYNNNNCNYDYHRQQNRRQETFRTYATTNRLRNVAVYYHFAISTFPVEIVIKWLAFILEYLLQLPIKVRNVRRVNQVFRSEDAIFKCIVDIVKLKLMCLSLKVTFDVEKAASIWGLVIRSDVYYKKMNAAVGLLAGRYFLLLSVLFVLFAYVISFEDKVLFNLNWSTKSQNDHHQKSISFTDEIDRNTDNYRFIEKLKAMDSQIKSLNEELQDIRNKYNELRKGNASKNNDTSMFERHEVNYIRSEDYQNQDSHNSFSRQYHHDHNDSEKSLTELNNDVKNDLKDFKIRICSMRTVHDNLFDRDNGKTTSVLANKKSKTVNQEPESKNDFEKLMTKFLDDQRVTNMFFKNNINDMILKMKKNENNFQTKTKNMERKIDERSKSQNVSSEQTDRTDPPPQAHTEQVNVVFTGSAKSDDSSKIQKDLPPPIIFNNKIEKDRPIKTTKKGYHMIKTNEYLFREYMPKIPHP